MQTIVKRGYGVALCVFLAAALAHATSIIYSNFGPGMSFDTVDSYYVTGSSFSSTCPPSPASCDVVLAESVGVQFTPSSTYTFDDVQVPVFLQAGTNSLDVYLETDSSGQPGSIVSEFQVDDEMTSSPTVLLVGEGQAGVTLVQGAADPTLDMGSAYWLVLSAGAADTEAAWSFNSVGDISTSTDLAVSCSVNLTTGAVSCYSSATGPWLLAPGIEQPAFEIDGTVPSSTVPEPGTVALMALGLLAILFIGPQRLRLPGR